MRALNRKNRAAKSAMSSGSPTPNPAPRPTVVAEAECEVEPLAAGVDADGGSAEEVETADVELLAVTDDDDALEMLAGPAAMIASF